MNITTHWRFFALITLGACVADSEPPTEIDFHDATLRQPDQAVVESESIRLYQDLAARLDERGVTPAELQAAADANDEEAVRELFGFTDEELEAAHARLVALAEGHGDAREDPGASGGPPQHQELWTCRPGLALCSLAAAERASKFPSKIGLAIFVAGELACLSAFCSWDQTDPGPGREKQ